MGALFTWALAEMGERESERLVAIEDRDRARAELIALSGLVDRLEDRLDAGAVGARELQQRLWVAERRLQQTREDLLAMVGPALPDGRHFGHLVVVGHNQVPPRLIVDVETWFTDQAAVEAAIEDGITIDPGINGYYIRNESPRWRVVEVAAGADVALTTYPYGDVDHPRIVSFQRFGALFTADDPSIAALPYWIVVHDGKVVGIQQQFIP